MGKAEFVGVARSLLKERRVCWKAWRRGESTGGGEPAENLEEGVWERPRAAGNSTKEKGGVVTGEILAYLAENPGS